MAPRALLPCEDIQRGDIGGFRYPEDIRQNYFKRVIGIHGDRIHMEAGAVIRNGVKLAKPCAQRLNVPPNNYRDNSEDRRYWGYFPRENIIGKPVAGTER